jgi:hypothetical protein
LSINQIRTELGSASGSLRTLSALAGFSTPDKISDFYGYSNLYWSATGGNSIFTQGSYKYHVFTSSGTFAITGNYAKSVGYLVMAGGGSGGGGGAFNQDFKNGAGGAGGVVENAPGASLTNGNITVTIGGGGAANSSASPTYINGNDGTPSTLTGILSVTATGGGGGAGYGGYGNQGRNGGCGGGAFGGTYGGTGGVGSQGQPGGNRVIPGEYDAIVGGAGGGGTVTAGNPGFANPTAWFQGGAGGNGGTYLGYGTPIGGGGGGGAGNGGPGGPGGTGGGGRGAGRQNGGDPITVPATSGTANTGGGGGTLYGGGGSGIVIFRYIP